MVPQEWNYAEGPSSLQVRGGVELANLKDRVRSEGSPGRGPGRFFQEEGSEAAEAEEAN